MSVTLRGCAAKRVELKDAGKCLYAVHKLAAQYGFVLPLVPVTLAKCLPRQQQVPTDHSEPLAGVWRVEAEARSSNYLAVIWQNAAK